MLTIAQSRNGTQRQSDPSIPPILWPAQSAQTPVPATEVPRLTCNLLDHSLGNLYPFGPRDSSPIVDSVNKRVPHLTQKAHKCARVN